MLNQVILVGRVVEALVSNAGSDEKSKTIIKLDIKRSFKNPETGDFDTDLVEVSLWDNITNQLSDQIKIGNLIGIKGRIQQSTIKTLSGLVAIPEIYGEKITFISTRE